MEWAPSHLHGAAGIHYAPGGPRACIREGHGPPPHSPPCARVEQFYLTRQNCHGALWALLTLSFKFSYIYSLFPSPFLSLNSLSFLFFFSFLSALFSSFFPSLHLPSFSFLSSPFFPFLWGGRCPPPPLDLPLGEWELVQVVVFI